ncbi:MAG: glutathione S-transferase family protein [Gammaproteobacteria bacterium]|nr:glutathione S-transferase family protein [Gammaproteobacteria bacterium]
MLVYGRHTSYNVQKVLWLLDELQVSYKHIELGSNPGDTETDEFGKLNPMRKVPVLVDNENVVWESNTILRYLANMYGSVKLNVENAYQRSLYERWMDWSQTYFEPAFIGVFWGYYRTPTELHNMEEIQKSLNICMNCLGKIDNQLDTQEYLAGNKFSLADICAGVFIFRLTEINLDVSLPKNVERWYKHLQRSKGYPRWVMSDFSSLKGRLQY